MLPVIVALVADLARQRADAIVTALRKSWQTARQLDAEPTAFTIYLLSAAGAEDGHILAYDFSEFAAFVGGVRDGDFDSLLDTGPPDEVQPALPAEDWTSHPLPPGYVEAEVIAALRSATPQLRWVAFGGRGGPSWARIHFQRGSDGVTATPDPVLTREEIAAIARIPHPPPTPIVVRGWLTAADQLRHQTPVYPA